MATKRQRAFALFGAVLFLITSSFLTIAFLISNIQSKNNSDAASKANQASQTAASKATTSKTSTAQSSTTKAKLAGTQMQNFTPVSSVSTLQTTDLVAGTGQTVKASDKVTVDYTGAVAANGVIFQSSLDTGKPVTFGLSQVIPGWTQGVPGMKVGLLFRQT
jgi:FKBP-type peptidyl-prolyl cis-trans isomerase